MVTSLGNMAKVSTILLLLSLLAITAVFECGAPSVELAQLILQVFDVVAQKNRAAGLPDAIIGIILSQLSANISYQPLECQDVAVNPDPKGLIVVADNVTTTCIIYGSTVTAVCNETCRLISGENVSDISPTTLLVSGILTTTNIITANWSIEMWQNVVDRVVQNLALGPFGSNFFTAFATVA
uniref:Secreted protein n=1 Tax=Angiostrongylus cantonensis TaxID=6313 RepID=A0A0K0D7E5_ANGCA